MLYNKTGTVMKKHITLVKPNKDKNSKSAAIKAKGGEGCLPIR
jgi:hypothetical protein